MLHFLLLSAYLTSTALPLPNIVLILTDDEDVMLSEEYIARYNIMPARDAIFRQNGIQFDHAFTSSPTCCVSRASILTGRYVHNHHVLNNTKEGNCWGERWQSEQEPYTYASYLQSIGYNTFFAGKYLNRYTNASHIPSGFNDWHGLIGRIDYYNYILSNNGNQTYYDDANPNNYHTTVIKNFALNFLLEHFTNQPESTPFLLVLSTVAAHAPFTVESKYQHLLHESTPLNELIRAPRTPNWNKINFRDHHGTINSQRLMNKKQVRESDWIFRHRLYTLKSVDDAIQEIYDMIATGMHADTLDNTYFMYTSDHGYHSGQFAMQFAKMQLYDTDLRVPFYIANSAPSFPKGLVSSVMANNIDIAPTLLDMAGIDWEAETDMDGKSLLRAVAGVSEEKESKFQMFLVEYNGEGYDHLEYRMCPSRVEGFDFSKCDAWNNTFSCLRWLDGSNEKGGYVYCNFKCFTEGRVETECEAEASRIEGEGEYYDLVADPWQMENLWNSLSDEEVEYFDEKIAEFQRCHGDECRELFGKNDVMSLKGEEEVDRKQGADYRMLRLLTMPSF